MAWPITFGSLTGTIPLSNLDTNFNAAAQLSGATFTGAILGTTGTFTGAFSMPSVALAGTSSTVALTTVNAVEPVTISATAATGTITFYSATQSILYYTSNASANWTVNLAHSSGTSMNSALSTGQAITVCFMVTQGSTAYYNNVVQVDGATSGVTTKWQGGAPSSGSASGVDVYTYTVIKTGSATFNVFASKVQFS